MIGAVADRFWCKVSKGDGCWEWIACRTLDGYGRIAVNGKVLRAHRVSWELHFGPIPAGLDVLHECDNPPCVNPSHLFLGTDIDNAADKAAKGRAPRLVGESSGCAKLTWADVSAIRRRYASGEVLQKDLAGEFGVRIQTISMITTGMRWPERGALCG